MQLSDVRTLTRLRCSVLIIPVFAAAALAACGGGGDSDGVASLGGDAAGRGATATTLSKEDAEKALLEWASCMRAEGVDIADPKVDDKGRVQIGITAVAGEDGDVGARPDRDTFGKAREVCGDPPATGGELTEEDRQEMQERALAFSSCMRSNGMEDFPDPDFSKSGPGAGPGTRIERRGGGQDQDAPSDAVVAGPFGSLDLDDPEVRAAFEACRGEGDFPGPATGRVGGAEAGS